MPEERGLTMSLEAPPDMPCVGCGETGNVVMAKHTIGEWAPGEPDPTTGDERLTRVGYPPIPLHARCVAKFSPASRYFSYCKGCERWGRQGMPCACDGGF